MKNNIDQFNILRKIYKKTYLNQRILAKDLGFSLGKLNYCLSILKKKGFVKLKNFKNNTNKFNRMSKNNYLYILTPKGVSFKIKLTINFIKKTAQDYDDLTKDLEINKNE
jgi:EPS-associated MarR family transcriptional regulator